MADFESSAGAFASGAGDEHEDDRDADEEACSDESDREREGMMPLDRMISPPGVVGGFVISVAVTLGSPSSISGTVAAGALSSIFGVMGYEMCSSSSSSSCTAGEGICSALSKSSGMEDSSCSSSVATPVGVFSTLALSVLAMLYGDSSSDSCSSRATNCGVTGGVSSATRSFTCSTDGDDPVTDGSVVGDGKAIRAAAAAAPGQLLPPFATGKIERGMRVA